MMDTPGRPTATFELEEFGSVAAVQTQIQLCEGKHPQQIAYSSFHDALTQICFGCDKVRTNMGVARG